MERKRWYKDKVFYQIWPRSFKDGDGDGMGDLWGVYEKLDYIRSLGCDGIWFSPIYPSPGADCGYDISNYRDIAPEFGGMEAFKKVLEGAHARDMKVVMDLVVNHTSDEHEWFQKSRRRIDPYTDYYIWRPGKPGGKLPNNWDSFFEGKAWTFDEVRGEYYLHLFAVKQPDLNMDNPKVREEVKGILRFWLDMGVDGFREDVITYISKKEGLPDDHLMPTCKGMPHYNHGPHIHEYLNEFKHDVLDHYDCFTLAEAPMVTPKRALTYIDEKNGQLDMMIQFQCVAADCLFTDYLPTKFSLRRMKKAFSSWQEKLRGRGWNSLYIENHDHPRIVSRYGSEEFWAQSAKCLAAMYLFQQGTPFIYQGQEIGMTNWRPGTRRHVRGRADPLHLRPHRAEAIGGGASAPAVAFLPGLRPHAGAVGRQRKRRVHHREAVVLCQPKLSGHQRCPAGCRPGLRAEFLPQSCRSAQEPFLRPVRRVPGVSEAFRQALSVFHGRRAAENSGCLLLCEKEHPLPRAQGLPPGGWGTDSVQLSQAAGRLLAALRMPGVSLEITTAGGSWSRPNAVIIFCFSGHTVV